MRRFGRLVVWIGAVMILALPACGEGTASTTPSASKTPSSSGVRSATAAPLPSEVPAMFTREAAKPDPHFDYGVVIQMTPGGFHPAWLVSPCCMPIIWVNLTSTPDSLLFDALKVRSGEIPPGKSFVYTPLNVESIAYHSLTDTSMSGVVQVNSTSEPGP